MRYQKAKPFTLLCTVSHSGDLHNLVTSAFLDYQNGTCLTSCELPQEVVRLVGRKKAKTEVTKMSSFLEISGSPNSFF